MQARAESGEGKEVVKSAEAVSARPNGEVAVRSADLIR